MSMNNLNPNNSFNRNGQSLLQRLTQQYSKTTDAAGDGVPVNYLQNLANNAGQAGDTEMADLLNAVANDATLADKISHLVEGDRGVNSAKGVTQSDWRALAKLSGDPNEIDAADIEAILGIKQQIPMQPAFIAIDPNAVPLNWTPYMFQNFQNWPVSADPTMFNLGGGMPVSQDSQGFFQQMMMNPIFSSFFSGFGQNQIK